MPVTAIVGANWGDEGKGKITDYLAKKSDIVIRFQGGNNAGHTIINEYGKFALHLLPSGIFYPHVTNLLGPGVAVNMKAFLDERNDVISSGVPEPKLLISNRAQVLMPYHIMFDKLEEERLADKKFGSTKSGIAPFYADKYLKIGIEIAALYDEAALRERIQRILSVKNILLVNIYKKEELKVDRIVEEIIHYRDKINSFVIDSTKFLHQALNEGKNILLEGQLGALRDPDHGIYPYSTSSSPLAGFASVGAGIPPYEIKRIIAVVKSYSTCVGAGGFVTELFNKQGEKLRNMGGDCGEYGATTGRPRRVGWFDCVATKYGCRVQGATEIALSLLDVLGYLEEISLCVQYDINGERTDDFPTTDKLQYAKPVYKTLPGWKKDITNIREFKKLPERAKDYIKFIEDKIEKSIKLISVGPKREDIIIRE